MQNSSVQEAMNDQIKLELTSAYAYLAMSACFEEQGWTGFAKWMRLQAEEELEHAMKFFDFIHDRGGRVALQGIDQPQAQYESALAAFETAFHHEQRVSEAINAIYALAVRENDFASQSFLNWFVDEQVEEEKNAASAIEQLRRAGDNPAALLMLDREFGRREDSED